VLRAVGLSTLVLLSLSDWENGRILSPWVFQAYRCRITEIVIGDTFSNKEERSRLRLCSVMSRANILRLGVSTISFFS